MLIGAALIVKYFIGQSSGVIGIIGFLLLFGGINAFNQSNNQDILTEESFADVEYDIMDEESYERERQIESGERQNTYEDGEGIDFSGINEQNEKIRQDAEKKRQELKSESTKKRIEMESERDFNDLYESDLDEN